MTNKYCPNLVYMGCFKALNIDRPRQDLWWLQEILVPKLSRNKVTRAFVTSFRRCTFQKLMQPFAERR